MGFITFVPICTTRVDGTIRDSLVAKVVSPSRKGLLVFWTFDLDEFSGKLCGLGSHPNMNAAKEALENDVQSSPCTHQRTTQHTSANR